MESSRYHVTATVRPMPNEACDRCGEPAVLQVRGWDRPLTQLHRALRVQTHFLCREHLGLGRRIGEHLAAHGPRPEPRLACGEWDSTPLTCLKPADGPGIARAPEHERAAMASVRVEGLRRDA